MEQGTYTATIRTYETCILVHVYVQHTVVYGSLGRLLDVLLDWARLELWAHIHHREVSFCCVDGWLLAEREETRRSSVEKRSSRAFHVVKSKVLIFAWGLVDGSWWWSIIN
jgi:hypothetical protein